jgi:transposase
MPKKQTIESSQVDPSPELEKKTRRVFSGKYKLRILEAADACEYGELGKLLRREKLYSNQLQQWRRELVEQGADGLKSKPGPSAKKSAEQRQIEHLERENMRLKKRLHIADGCIDLQKKALSMIEHMRNGSDA